MSALKPVRMAILGCDGYAGVELIPRIWSMPEEAELVAGYSPDLHSAGAAACRARGVRVYDQMDDLLEEGGFEVVVNATPIHAHAPLTHRCLEAGCPVWLEKPPVATVRDLDALARQADRCGLQVGVGFNWLYLGLIQQLKRDLVSGRYGRVKRVSGIGAWIRGGDYFTRNNWAGRLRVGEEWVLDGTINNPFSHVLCNGLYLAAGEVNALAAPETVEAELYRANDIESEDTSCLRIRTREGVEVLTHFTLAPDGVEIEPTTVVETERAEIQLVGFTTLRVKWRGGKELEYFSGEDSREEMLRAMCRAQREGEAFPFPLEMFRPFTLAVNGAFESSGTPHPIPASELSSRRHGEGSAVMVKGMKRILLEAHRQGRLFSEAGVPWAVPGKCLKTSSSSATARSLANLGGVV